jgi:hypothetical protein
MHSNAPAERGWRMACAAMQMMWQQEANNLPITQITRPELVHEIIASQPGLDEACPSYPRFLVSNT